MTSIYSLRQRRSASGETLLTNSTKRAPRTLAPRGTTKGAQGLRVQLGNGLRAPRRRPTSVLTTRRPYTTVSCIEGRRHAGGELGRKIHQQRYEAERPDPCGDDCPRGLCDNNCCHACLPGFSAHPSAIRNHVGRYGGHVFYKP